MERQHNEVADPAGSGDDRLIEELRGAARRFDPLPESVREAARASLTWRTVDAELAALAFDSAVEPSTNARSGGDSRLLTFSAPGFSVEMEVAAMGIRRRLVGQVVPPQGARIEVRHPGGVVIVEADELGRFSAEGVSAGPVCLRCPAAAGTTASAIITEWVLL
jgi:hypothetical protein